MSGIAWDGRECSRPAVSLVGHNDEHADCLSSASKGGTDLLSVLHLAASTLTQQAYSFFSILLKNQHTQINAQDSESGYTALHRALFAGNIKAARELLARSDCDTSIRDSEGMTAFELYNGTVDGVGFPRLSRPFSTDAVDQSPPRCRRHRSIRMGRQPKLCPGRRRQLGQDVPGPSQSPHPAPSIRESRSCPAIQPCRSQGCGDGQVAYGVSNQRG